MNQWTEPEPDPGPSRAVAEYEAVLEAAGTLLEDVDRALDRLSDGTYGTCEVCGTPIGEDLLTLDPVGRTCAAHRQPAAGVT
jgi:RNA polymerase-binding transcription factor DksA